MKYLDEYRDPKVVKRLVQDIQQITTQPWNIMEVCGGQTHSIVRHGLDRLLPENITLLHGPGCPVCVTPMEVIDYALELVRDPAVILCTFGDMVRVPGSEQDMQTAKAKGGDVRVVYSPLDALQLAQKHPERQVVFLAVGFETTAPAYAMTIFQAMTQNVTNFSLLVSQVLVPPALEALLSDPDATMDGFLAAGHVCTIMGEKQYVPLAEKYRVPIVITGFEPTDILQGILSCIQQLEQGSFVVDNQYKRVVKASGNQKAQQLINEIFEIVDQEWRGLGTLANSGLRIRPAYQAWDARFKFTVRQLPNAKANGCISGMILQGKKKPNDCPLFGTICTPEHALGATMVSSEGTCAAYYRYRKDSHGN
jgi:hydrogenase expression/formation protein HypD